MTSVQTYEQYHQICIDHYHEKISVEQFRQQLCDLFRPHEAIMRALPTFFDESGETDSKAPPLSSSTKPKKSAKVAAPKASQPSAQQANGAQHSQSQQAALSATKAQEAAQKK